MHSAVVTAAKVHDKHPLRKPLHGQEARVYGDCAYAAQQELIGTKAPAACDAQLLSKIDAVAGRVLPVGDVDIPAAVGAVDHPVVTLDRLGVILAGADYVAAGVTYPNGTANTPSITFGSNTATGLYLVSNNVLGFATGGTAAATIDSSQIGRAHV